jgi:hypothetical protein
MATELLAYPNDRTAHLVSAVVIVVLGLALLGFLAYGFLTRHRVDWDEVLRRWTAEQRRGDDR